MKRFNRIIAGVALALVLVVLITSVYATTISIDFDSVL